MVSCTNLNHVLLFVQTGINCPDGLVSAMLLNADTVVRMRNSDCILVPYLREHVKLYHGWMSDAELRRLTCSERLSLEEEYENQLSWRTDASKLTFIIHDGARGCICGDVNLYLKPNSDEEPPEIEVMIADTDSRRRGLARDALALMLTYSNKHLGVRKFVAKILANNQPSINLFRKLGFTHVRDLEIFQETHYEIDLAAGKGVELVRDITDRYSEESYLNGPMGNAKRNSTL